MDHIDKENNIYDHFSGKFIKVVPPRLKEQRDAVLNISHAQELLDAVSKSFNKGLKCRLLILKGTKFGTTTGGIKSAADGDYWQVTAFNDGSVAEGFNFTLERVTA